MWKCRVGCYVGLLVFDSIDNSIVQIYHRFLESQIYYKNDF